VPGDVGIATPFALPSAAEISGVSPDLPLIAANAIDLLVAQLHRNDRGLPRKPKRLVVTGHWVEGDTLKPG
jgi:hypothetical protein